MGILDQLKHALGSRKSASDGGGENPPQPPRPPAAGDALGSAAVYIVQSGDTLWKIAQEQFGDGARYREIFEANRDVLDDPDHILPGQELNIPH